MSRWMLNCKEFSALVSERLDRPLSFWDKMAIRLHCIMCPACNHIQAQLETLSNACRCIPGSDTEVEEQCHLPDDVRLRIKAELKKYCA
jgi:hypothetical protein